MNRGQAGETVIAVAADPYHRAAVAYGRAESALIADRFVEQVLRPLIPAASFQRRADLEWLIWLSTGYDGLDGLIEAVRGKLGAQQVQIDGAACFLDICMGVAVGADLPEAITSADLMHCADAALSTALTKHHNVVFADPTTLTLVRDEIEVARRLTQSVEDDFVLHYQPIVELPSRRVVGYESLLRWHTESGLLTPDVFLAVAEDTSLIVPIGRHAIGDAIRTLSTDITPALGDEAFLTINLSSQQLWDGRIADHVDGLIRTYAVRPDRVWIEVRENEAVRLGTSAALAVRQLHEIGCTICVDDLGSGFSALRYVRDLPIDVLKVDKTLIVHLLEDPSNRAVVRAICDMARATGITIVAEGVEDEELIPALEELGFNLAQGYLFGRPEAPARAFAR